jgi:hypothetical protein
MEIEVELEDVMFIFSTPRETERDLPPPFPFIMIDRCIGLVLWL